MRPPAALPLIFHRRRHTQSRDRVWRRL